MHIDHASSLLSSAVNVHKGTCCLKTIIIVIVIIYSKEKNWRLCFLDVLSFQSLKQMTDAEYFPAE